MKKFLYFFCLIHFIIYINASASTQSWTEILSDNKSTTGWTLWTDIGIDGISGNPVDLIAASCGEFDP
jgi:hypothetical protein